MTRPAIALAGVSVSYGSRVALDAVDFSVRPGEIFGLLGPNGAGKSTTVDVCCGLRRPQRGTVKVLGLDVATSTRKVRAAIGVVPQDSGLYNELNPVEHLELSAALYGVERPAARIEELLTMMGLWERRRDRVSGYSGGMRRRVALARALLHDPAVLFLDEPTLGVDVQGRRALWDHVSGLRAQGKSVLLTTNYLDEATTLCDRVAILDHGKVLACAPPSELRHRSGGLTVVLGCGADAPKIDRMLASRPDVLDVSRDGSEVRVRLKRDDAAAAVVAAATSAGKISTMTTESPSLEDVFLSLTGRALRE